MYLCPELRKAVAEEALGATEIEHAQWPREHHLQSPIDGNDLCQAIVAASRYGGAEFGVAKDWLVDLRQFRHQVAQACRGRLTRGYSHRIGTEPEDVAINLDAFIHGRSPRRRDCPALPSHMGISQPICVKRGARHGGGWSDWGTTGTGCDSIRRARRAPSYRLASSPATSSC